MLKFSSLYRGLAAFLLLIVGLSSCSQNDQTQQINAEQQSKAKELAPVPKPNPQAMEADVASLLNSAWAKLQADLAAVELDDSQRAEAYAEYGLAAYGNGVSVPAEIAIDNAILLAPKDARWTYFKALMAQASGDLSEAAVGFERVIELRPNDLPALLRLGNVRFEQAQAEQAEQIYQQALNIEPNSATALYGLGRIASSRGQTESAISYLEKALELQPFADRLNYLLGIAWRNLGDREKAESYLAAHGTNEPSFTDPLFDQISGGQARLAGLWANMNAGSQAFVDNNYGVAVEEFRKATVNHPDDPRSWQSLGMGLNKMGDAQGAIDAYQKALELDRENAEIHHTLAELLIFKQDYAQAETLLSRAIELDPQLLVALKSQARLLSVTGRNEQALQVLDRAAELDDQSSDVAVARAETLIALGRASEAEQSLSAAIAANPMDTSAKLAYGIVLAESGKIDAAEAQLQTALGAAQDDEERGRAHYALGNIELRRGDGEAAIRSFGEALKLNPQHNAAGLELARTFLRVKDYQQSLAAYEVHIGLWPDLDVSRVEAARVALMLGDGNTAHRLLAEGIQRVSASARLHGTFARLLILTTDANLRDPELACQHANLAVTASPSINHRETVAICEAARGNFSQASKLQNELISLSGSQVSARAKTRMQKNLQRYQRNELGRLPLDAG